MSFFIRKNYLIALLFIFSMLNIVFVNSYEETIIYTKEALLNPKKLEDKRLSFSKDLCGEIDGEVSVRIYDAVLKRVNR